jgi:hypothetical protein
MDLDNFIVGVVALGHYVLPQIQLNPIVGIIPAIKVIIFMVVLEVVVDMLHIQQHLHIMVE